MTKKIKILATLIFFLFFQSYTINAQLTKVIDYTNWNNSNCNVFRPNVSPPSLIVVDGVTHRTTCGQPKLLVNTFNGAPNNQIILNSSFTNSEQRKGTEFKIDFNFKQGYNYKITVNVYGKVPQGFEPYGKLLLGFTSVTNPSTANSSGNSCNGDERLDNAFFANGGGNNNIELNTSAGFVNKDYFFNQLPNSQTNLFICSNVTEVTNNSASSFAYIRKITIVETLPPPSFLLIPNNLVLQCNSSLAQTFTVNNNNNTPGVSGYIWNLGTNNGWLYNGTNAPQTINTTNNTINLTPCGLLQKNITAKALVGTTEYATNVSTVSNNCNYSIVGNTSICTFSDYSVNNLPINANVVWSLSNSTSATLSCTSCPITRVTKLGVPYNVNLIANITVPGCNSILTLTKPLQIGSPLSALNLVASFGLDCNIVNLTANIPNATITWTTTNGLLINGNPSPYTATGNSVSISAPSAGVTGTVSAISTNPCDRDINPYSFNGGCIAWENSAGEPALIVSYGAPQRGEPLQAYINPIPAFPNGVAYHWFINGNLIDINYNTNFSTYDWPCNYGSESILSVVAVEYNSAATPPLNATFTPTCTGARMAINTPEISIFPNPASSNIIINLNDVFLEKSNKRKKENGLINIKIMDKFGNIKKIFTRSNTEKIITVDVSQLSADLYFVEISNTTLKKRLPFTIVK